MGPKTKTPFESVYLLDIQISKLTVNDLIHYIIQSTRKNNKTIIAHVNVRAMNFVYENPAYRTFFKQADLVFCDGFGVLLGAKLAGFNVQAKYRSTCPDWIESLAYQCVKHNRSIFLLAGKPGIAASAAIKLQRIAPGLRIATHHGYFNKTGPENQQVINTINQFKPDILYVGFGMPIQEQWIEENIVYLTTKVFLPLGACLDFYTNNTYRGPHWMTDHGLEWLARLLTEPRRLWKRYIIGNPLFLYRVLKHRFLARNMIDDG